MGVGGWECYRRRRASRPAASNSPAMSPDGVVRDPGIRQSQLSSLGSAAGGGLLPPSVGGNPTPPTPTPLTPPAPPTPPAPAPAEPPAPTVPPSVLEPVQREAVRSHLVEPASPPVHMASLVQQPAGASRLQVRSDWQVSAVHELPSLQSPSRRQQPITLVYVQVPEAQVSVVHGLPSSQPWLFVQPQATGVKRQVLVAVSHSSVVQLVESVQLVAFTQQSDVGTVLQRCVDRSHVLTVQALPSLQSVSVMQQFSMLDREHVCAVGSHVSRVQGLPSEQSPAVLQQFCSGV